MLDKLDALKIFCTAAETLKFRETANRLGIAPQIVTRAIAELEQQLGEILFLRNTRQMTLTPFGQLLWPKAELLIAESETLFTAGKEQSHRDMTGHVRISLPPLVENQELVRHLLQSLEAYPELTIEWLPTDAHLNIIDEQIDIGIRIGAIPDNRFIVKAIRPVGIRIVAAPGLLTHLGMPETLRALQYDYPLSALSNSNSGRVWPWQFADGRSFFPAKPVFIANDIGSELAAALAGRTCSQLPDINVRPYLQSGALTNLFPELNFSPYQLYIFRPHQPLVPKRIRIVFDNLTKILHTLFGE